MSSRRKVGVLLVAAGVAALAAVGAGLGAQSALAPAVRWNVDRAGLVAHGYDVVAYFTDGRAVEGRPEFATEWQGATWRFASAEHRDTFAASPERYAPQYGGFCSYAVSRNYTADIDPQAWTVVNGRLYLNYSLDTRTVWLRERDANIEKANANWPALSRKK